MATYRTGNDYRTAIGLETNQTSPAHESLGSGVTNIAGTIAFTELTLLPDKMEQSGGQAQIATNSKTGTGLQTTCEFKGGYKNYQVVMSGILSHEHEILLKALTPTPLVAKTYVINALPNPLNSYVIMRIWKDAPQAGVYNVDKAIGCQLMKLVITGQSGGMVTYEATFMSMGYTRETTQLIGGTDPGYECKLGFNFGDMHADTELLFGDTEHLKSFTLTLGYDLADDATSFQNSLTRLETIPVKATCELQYVTNYNVANTSYDKIAETLLFGATALTEVLALYAVDGAKTYKWTITTNGQLVDFKAPDPDRALFESQVTERLCYYATPAYPVTIVVVESA